MRLRDLEAEFLKYTGNGTHQRVGEQLEGADGILFCCPKCWAAAGKREGVHGVLCWFEDRVPDDVVPGPGRWKPQGTGLDDLSFVPGKHSNSVHLTGGGCQWHGFVTAGDAT